MAKQKEIPPGCWLSPTGKTLSKYDLIVIRLPREDLDAIHRYIDATTHYLDEARDGKERVPFVERLMMIQDRLYNKHWRPARDDILTLHRVLHVAAGHVNEPMILGNDKRAIAIERLAKIRRVIMDAVSDHDDVPQGERSY